MTAPVYEDDLLTVWKMMSVKERIAWVHEALDAAEPGSAWILCFFPVVGWSNDWRIVEYNGYV